jgi:hypothetical protein
MTDTGPDAAADDKRAGEGARDALAGLIFVGFGALALVVGADYPAGTAVRMGPGYLPRIVAWGLVALGAAAILRGALVGGWRLTGIAPRPIAAIGGAVLAFAFTIDRLGLFVASVASVLVAAAGEADPRWRQTIAIALGLASFCSALFGAGLGLAIPIWPR